MDPNQTLAVEVDNCLTARACRSRPGGGCQAAVRLHSGRQIAIPAQLVKPSLIERGAKCRFEVGQVEKNRDRGTPPDPRREYRLRRSWALPPRERRGRLAAVERR
jgi:hypothetical protein